MAAQQRPDAHRVASPENRMPQRFGNRNEQRIVASAPGDVMGRRRVPMVDENKVEGVLDETVGHVKDAAGGLTGDEGLQAEGKFDQIQGKVQQEYGDFIDQAQEQIEEAAALVRDQPVMALGIAAGVGFLLGYLLTPSRG